MDWMVRVVIAGPTVAVSIGYRLWVMATRKPHTPHPQSERAIRDFRRPQTLGRSHFVGLDNTGHHR